jgi:hypothetical protein
MMSRCKPMNDERLSDNRANLLTWIQRIAMILKDDLHLPPCVAKSVSSDFCNIFAAELNRSGIRIFKAQNASRRGRFSASAFAD